MFLHVFTVCVDAIPCPDFDIRGYLILGEYSIIWWNHIIWKMHDIIYRKCVFIKSSIFCQWWLPGLSLPHRAASLHRLRLPERYQHCADVGHVASWMARAKTSPGGRLDRYRSMCSIYLLGIYLMYVLYIYIYTMYTLCIYDVYMMHIYIYYIHSVCIVYI